MFHRAVSTSAEMRFNSSTGTSTGSGSSSLAAAAPQYLDQWQSQRVAAVQRPALHASNLATGAGARRVFGIASVGCGDSPAALWEPGHAESPGRSGCHGLETSRAVSVETTGLDPSPPRERHTHAQQERQRQTLTSRLPPTHQTHTRAPHGTSPWAQRNAFLLCCPAPAAPLEAARIGGAGREKIHT